MEETILVDLFHEKLKLPSDSLEKWLKEYLAIELNCLPERNPRVYIICENKDCDSQQEGANHSLLKRCPLLKDRAMVLGYPSLADALYNFKFQIDEHDLVTVKILTPWWRKALLQEYLSLLFTAVYQFSFLHLSCSPQDENVANAMDEIPPTAQQSVQVNAEVSTFLRRLPGRGGDITILQSSVIPDDCFLHGFTTRAGGISYIPTLSSLNMFCSSKRKDPRAVIEENICRVAEKSGFNPKSYYLVKVNHANDVWVMDKTEPESYDGIVTNRRGVTIAAPGADCIPLLFADPVKKVIGAAHSGWKGTITGVAMETVNAMVKEYASQIKDIRVVLGPSVGPCCLQLQKESAMDFHAVNPSCVKDLNMPKPHVDIRLTTRILLERGGIHPENIQDITLNNGHDEKQPVQLCTSCLPDMFYSHMRDGVNFGIQIGFISIKE
ncbi:purine nucleoside phosphorylase LACC1 [Erpetoichthys calabaricus]|uniref:purine nucleoside phosphorylase LACC1 n=1 Tax=Erpetoichthys calabaricus TaxID=27687 RepID=UPI002234A9AF|nr:purine nucleoside phosphorylase LACC1 [Erpetoichthys calabaricus]XP_028655500.2 purine nucleoside phosphorylase LACC1 [Erpetoichthys calabaricus]